MDCSLLEINSRSESRNVVDTGVLDSNGAIAYMLEFVCNGDLAQQVNTISSRREVFKIQTS